MVFIRFLFKILDQVGSPFSLLLNFLSFNNLFYISYLCFLFYSGIFTSLSEISLCPFSLFLFHLSHFLYPIPLYLRFFFSSSYFFLAIRQGSPGGWKKGVSLWQDTGNSWESKWCRVQYRSLTAGPLRTAMSDSTRYWAVGATYTQAYFARLTIS